MDRAVERVARVREARGRLLAWGGALTLAAACSVGDIDLSSKACPCIAGYVCDVSKNRCVLGVASDAGVVDGKGADLDAPVGDAEEAPGAPSCAVLPAICGGGDDCCASTLVLGGTFNRSNDPKFPATVSDFRLDVYEVTVGRFRAFVEAGKGIEASPPASGDGAHPKIPQSGWDSAFNGNLPVSTSALKTALQCDRNFATWTDAPGGHEALPMNCVTWFDALAFCAWDGGWLPTEAEWNYAAAGGGEQRAYPFTSDIDPSKAAYDCTGDGSDAGACALGDILPVGSRSPQGDGKWGQKDLAGNLWEWMLDWRETPYRLAQCDDCADLQPGTSRSARGGGYDSPASELYTSYRYGQTPTRRLPYIGFRCARPSAP